MHEGGCFRQCIRYVWEINIQPIILSLASYDDVPSYAQHWANALCGLMAIQTSKFAAQYKVNNVTNDGVFMFTSENEVNMINREWNWSKRSSLLFLIRPG